MDKTLKHWEKEKKMIPKMIRTYCRGNHKEERKKEGVKHSELCSKCQGLTQYALFRLEKCPFKKGKSFCSACKIHCYLPQYREEIRKVMRYSGPRMLFTHPVFALSHAILTIKYKKKLKKEKEEKKQ